MSFSIDQYAYRTRLREIDPALKVFLAAEVILLVLWVNSPQTSAAAFVVMVALCVWLVGVPLRMVGKLLLAEALFLALSLIGIVLSFSLTQPTDGVMWSISVGAVVVSTSPAAIAQGGALLLRAMACAAALAFLIFSTPLIDGIEVMRRLRLPALLIDLFQMIYRFIFVMLERLIQMQIAQQSRLGDANARALMRSSALLASNLFLDIFRRNQRLQMALDSRCFEGELRILPLQYKRDYRWLALAGAIAVLLIGVARL